MSNHSVGYALQDVGSYTLELYDSGRISLETAKGLILRLGDAIRDEDGNYSEFIEFFTCRCGNCYAKVDEDLVATEMIHGYSHTVHFELCPAVDDAAAEHLVELATHGAITAASVCKGCWPVVRSMDVPLRRSFF